MDVAVRLAEPSRDAGELCEMISPSDIGLSYGIGFITNPKVFRRLKEVLKFLIALKNGKEKD